MKKIPVIMIACVLLLSCANLTLPIEPPETSIYKDCVGMNYVIKGMVYVGSVDSANALSGVPVLFSQNSNCSPTAGGQTAYTAEDGSFEFKVYIHDTDTFDFLVEVEGYDSLSARTGGFDYLASSRLPVVMVLQPSKTPAELAQSWQANIDQLSTLLSAQKIPQHLLVQKPILQGDEFDIMTVFDVLDHIRMAEGYQLAYVYIYDSMGSYPRLYVHSTDEAPYTTASEYYAERPECSSRKDAPPQCEHMQYIVTDSSEMGYLQWILMYVMGRQFYLDWHANYNDTTLVATYEALDRIVTKHLDKSMGYPMSKVQIEKARTIDPTPQITIGDETVAVRVVWFTKWGGFFETRHKLSRTFPHTILETSSKILLDYDCGVMY
ncbi:MAG: hypothetical protein ABIG43_07140 [Chloroflexota bacterium]